MVTAVAKLTDVLAHRDLMDAVTDFERLTFWGA